MRKWLCRCTERRTEPRASDLQLSCGTLYQVNCQENECDWNTGFHLKMWLTKQSSALGCWDSDKWNVHWSPIYFIFKMVANMNSPCCVGLTRCQQCWDSLHCAESPIRSQLHCFPPFPVMTQLGECLKVSGQGFRLAKRQVLQWIHLENMAQELLMSHHWAHGRLCQVISAALKFS